MKARVEADLAGSSWHFCTACFWMLGNYRTLFGNKIKSVAKRAFSGLEGLEHL